MRDCAFGCLVRCQGYSEDWISGKLYLSEPMERIKEYPLEKAHTISGDAERAGALLRRLRLLPQGSSPSQQGRLFMKKNLTWISKMKTMQLVAWPYIDCDKRGR